MSLISLTDDDITTVPFIVAAQTALCLGSHKLISSSLVLVSRNVPLGWEGSILHEYLMDLRATTR